jgi:hypothetical protein
LNESEKLSEERQARQQLEQGGIVDLFERRFSADIKRPVRTLFFEKSAWGARILQRPLTDFRGVTARWREADIRQNADMS